MNGRMFHARVEKGQHGFVILDRVGLLADVAFSEPMLGAGVLVFAEAGHAQEYADALNRIEYEPGTRLLNVSQRAAALDVAREHGHVVELAAVPA